MEYPQNYIGNLTGVIPSTTDILQKADELQETWTSHNINICFEQERKISMTLSAEGYLYNTILCKWIKEDTFQLTMKSNDGYIVQVYLWIYYNKSIGIRIEGTWTEEGKVYDLIGRLQPLKKQ